MGALMDEVRALRAENRALRRRLRAHGEKDCESDAGDDAGAVPEASASSPAASSPRGRDAEDVRVESERAGARAEQGEQLGQEPAASAAVEVVVPGSRAPPTPGSAVSVVRHLRGKGQQGTRPAPARAGMTRAEGALPPDVAAVPGDKSRRRRRGKGGRKRRGARGHALRAKHPSPYMEQRAVVAPSEGAREGESLLYAVPGTRS